MDHSDIYFPKNPGKRRKAKDGEPLRFLLSIKNTDNKECIFWPFGKAGNGYPIIRLNGRATLAHRVMCAIKNDVDIPSSKTTVRHLCGKGHLGCVNPNHLVFGTHKQNSADMVEHGTRQYGEDVPASKLTADQVIAIRKDRRTLRSIAEDYNCMETNIGHIKKRRSWRWLPD